MILKKNYFWVTLIEKTTDIVVRPLVAKLPNKTCTVLGYSSQSTAALIQPNHAICWTCTTKEKQPQIHHPFSVHILLTLDHNHGCHCDQSTDTQEIWTLYTTNIWERDILFWQWERYIYIYIYGTLESCITSRSMMTSLQTTKNETQGSLANT